MLKHKPGCMEDNSAPFKQALSTFTLDTKVALALMDLDGNAHQF